MLDVEAEDGATVLASLNRTLAKRCGDPHSNSLAARCGEEARAEAVELAKAATASCKGAKSGSTSACNSSRPFPPGTARTSWTCPCS